MNVVAINAMLLGLVGFMGSGAKFKVFAGAKPAEGGAETTLLAAAVLAYPVGTISSGVLVLQQANPAGDLASGSGVAAWGRLEAADGTWIADFTVSGPSGAGQVKITMVNPPAGDPEGKIYQGGEFFLGMVTLGE
jgi:hypothetical protein